MNLRVSRVPTLFPTIGPSFQVEAQSQFSGNERQSLLERKVFDPLGHVNLDGASRQRNLACAVDVCILNVGIRNDSGVLWRSFPSLLVQEQVAADVFTVTG